MCRKDTLDLFVAPGCLKPLHNESTSQGLRSESL